MPTKEEELLRIATRVDTDIVGQDDDPAKVRASTAKLEARGKDRTISVGLKLNNPGMIKVGRKWKGLSPISEHPEFCTFSDAAWGVRAVAISLQEKAALGADPFAAVKAEINGKQGRDPYADEVIRQGLRLAGL